MRSEFSCYQDVAQKKLTRAALQSLHRCLAHILDHDQLRSLLRRNCSLINFTSCYFNRPRITVVRDTRYTYFVYCASTKAGFYGGWRVKDYTKAQLAEFVQLHCPPRARLYFIETPNFLLNLGMWKAGNKFMPPDADAMPEQTRRLWTQNISTVTFDK